jgi:pimeloyl-ACP methyl ester carboxylesterase
LVVFVHGIAGSATETWRQVVKSGSQRNEVYFPSVVHDDTTFRDAAIGVFDYPLSSMNLEDVTRSLYRTLQESRFARYERVAFVAHSQGALVVAHYLALWANAGYYRRPRPVGAVFLAPVFFTKALASTVLFLSPSNLQLRSLSWWSSFVRPAREDFLRVKEHYASCSDSAMVFIAGYESKPTWLPRIKVGGTQLFPGLMICSSLDAIPYDDGWPMELPGNHSQVPKVKSNTCEVYQFVADGLCRILRRGDRGWSSGGGVYQDAWKVPGGLCNRQPHLRWGVRLLGSVDFAPVQITSSGLQSAANGTGSEAIIDSRQGRGWKTGAELFLPLGFLIVRGRGDAGSGERDARFALMLPGGGVVEQSGEFKYWTWGGELGLETNPTFKWFSGTFFALAGPRLTVGAEGFDLLDPKSEDAARITGHGSTLYLRLGWGFQPRSRYGRYRLAADWIWKDLRSRYEGPRPVQLRYSKTPELRVSVYLPAWGGSQ